MPSKRPKRTGVEEHIAIVKDRDELHRLIDEIAPDAIGVLLTRANLEADDNELNMRMYGMGRYTDFMALIAYAQVCLLHDFFEDDD